MFMSDNYKSFQHNLNIHISLGSLKIICLDVPTHATSAKPDCLKSELCLQLNLFDKISFVHLCDVQFRLQPSSLYLYLYYM